MRWTKIAASLQSALAKAEPEDTHPVFVRSAPDTVRADSTERFPMRVISDHLYSATLDQAAVDSLSEEPWVESIALAERAEPSPAPSPTPRPAPGMSGAPTRPGATSARLRTPGPPPEQSS